MKATEENENRYRVNARIRIIIKIKCMKNDSCIECEDETKQTVMKMNDILYGWLTFFFLLLSIHIVYGLCNNIRMIKGLGVL